MFVRKSFFTAVIVGFALFLTASCNRYNMEWSGSDYGVFDDCLLSRVEPQGWIKEFLERQKDGLSGHPEALSYPYNTALWDGEIKRQSDHGENWWRYEQTAYYTDGILKLGYLLGDSLMIARGENGVSYTLEHATPEGLLGSEDVWAGKRWRMWPQAVFFRSMKSVYEMTGNELIPSALEKYYLNYDAAEIGDGRNICNIEGMLWTYAKTGNHELLELAVEAYETGKYELMPSVLEKGDPIVIHGVTFCEMHKLPALLYAYTGEQRYLELAGMAEDNLVGNNMLPDGVPTSAEWVKGHDVMAAHETCNVSDFTWGQGYHLMADGKGYHADMIERAVFNAGPGAVTKDFKALQYFSCVNQFNVTGESDHNEYRKGLTWMAYRPTHETECCAGNVHRFMPNYVQRMWMTDRQGGLVAALYGPSKVEFGSMTVSQTSEYPFEDELRFEFSGGASKFPFTFRIPSWCKEYDVYLNGREFSVDADPGEFATIERRWKNGDVLTLKFGMDIEFRESLDSAGVYVSRGPLLYTYEIPSAWTEDNKVYPGLNGKKSENPDFKCWNITPAGLFNYALAGNEAELVEIAAEGYPYENPSRGISVPVKKIKWDLEGGIYTPAIPSCPDVLNDTVEHLILVPYGSTELRLTVFPKAY